MSLDEERDAPEMQVQDTDNVLDRQLKKRLINLRNQVDERWDDIFVKSVIAGENPNTSPELLQAWGAAAKQYLTAIEPLLVDEDITDSQHYYREIPIGEVELVPPDTDDIPFSEIAQTEGNELHFRLRYDLPDRMELPESETVTFTGLREVIERPALLTHTWNLQAGPEHGGVLRLTARQVVPKEVYRNAVRHADQFLQNAGVGFEISAAGLAEDSLAPDY